MLVIILTLLEISLSIDNAVVNSRVLGTMSRAWQRLFMTLAFWLSFSINHVVAESIA